MIKDRSQTFFWSTAILVLAACSGKNDTTLAAPPLPLNDTGTSFCRNDLGTTASCDSALAQDGNLGKDASAAKKQGRGPLGFDWTKLTRSGAALVDQAQSWQPTGSEANSTHWSCVQDNHTNLLWEVKSSDESAINSATLRYSWYEPDDRANGENSGLQNTEDCNGVPCNTLAYSNRLNTLNWCGRSDWRLPSTNELLSLVVTDNLDLVVDTDFFPNGVNDQYWSYQTYAPIRERAWYLYFSDGSFGFTLKSQPNYVRLVSGDSTISPITQEQ